VLQREVFVLKFVPVDAGLACPIAVYEIATLNHEIFDNTVERAVLVANGQIRLPERHFSETGFSLLVLSYAPKLASAKLAKVLCGFWANIREKLNLYASSRDTADRHIKEHYWVLCRHSCSNFLEDFAVH
jgi:hypothetical protein